MIEVEIRGPVAKKEYEKLKKLLESAGENQLAEYQMAVSYIDRGFNNRAVRLEQKNGTAKIYIETGKLGERKEIATELASGAFASAIEMLAELGYKKASVSVREVLSCEYGGALFSLFDPGEDSFYYEAAISVSGPDEAKEAKQKLEKLARNFKLPMWSPIDMIEFTRKLSETANYRYDYETDGSGHFQDKFGI